MWNQCVNEMEESSALHHDDIICWQLYLEKTPPMRQPAD